MQRFVTAVLVVLAVAVSAGGVAVDVRADGAQAAAAQAPAKDQCATPTYQPIHLNGQLVESAAKDDVVPLNSQGYNYDAYDAQWRPEIKAAPAPVPASPAKP